MNVWKRLVLGYLGGMGYTALELLWRGRSHWSMFLVGGICFLLIGWTEKLGLPLFVRSVAAAGMVTGVELLSGMALNLGLGLGVWDYGSQPFNLLGQICPGYFFLWVQVSWGAILLDRQLRRRLFRETPAPLPGIFLPRVKEAPGALLS